MLSAVTTTNPTVTSTPSNIFDVLSGNKAVKGEVSLSPKNIAIVCGIVLLTVIIGVLLIKKIK